MSVGTAAAASRWPSDLSLRRVGRALCRHPEIVTALLCVLLLVLGQRGPDLPAQAYRVYLVRRHGLVAFDTHWYAGHSLPGYSLLFPPLAAFVGARLLGALSCVAATAAFTRLLRGRSSSGHDVAVLWFSVVVVVDLVVGRLPFALGLAFGLAALAATRDRITWVVPFLAAGCGAASPLAGAFLLLCGAAALPVIGWRRAAAFLTALIGVGAAVVFGEGGWFPFTWPALLFILLLSVGGLVLVPRRSRVTRRGLWLYALSSLALFPWHNAIGGNMARLGATVGGPLVAYELMRIRQRAVLAVVAIPLLIWEFAPVPTSLAAGPVDPASHRGYYTPLIRYLDAHGGTTGRLEVPLTDGRWEADYLATDFLLARGWERQVDLGDNPVLYERHLTASAYHRWLLANGVRWVALPDVPLDNGEVGERALLTGPTPPYLRLVWSDRHWKLWRVVDARPLVSGPVRLVRLGVAVIDLDATGPGTATVLVRWTKLWRVTVGDACVAPTADGWTSVQLMQPGPVRIEAKVGLGALAGQGSAGSCHSS